MIKRSFPPVGDKPKSDEVSADTLDLTVEAEQSELDIEIELEGQTGAIDGVEQSEPLSPFKIADPVPSAASQMVERHCLLVDDSRMIRGLSRRIVEELGYKVTEAEDGKEALARCAVLMPDLVIVDWDMPVMTGIEFVTALRAIEGGAKPKVVFCTSKNGVQDVQRGMSAGANEWIVKPFDKPKMLSKLTKIGAA